MLNRLRNLIRNTFAHQRFDVYTDGSHKNGWGSWAFVVVKQGQVIHEASGRERRGLSNQMEFRAAQQALSFLNEGAQARFFSDSRILIRTMTTHESPAAFNEQALHLESLCLNKKISWHWVKAHSGVQYNERCDELCIQARHPL